MTKFSWRRESSLTTSGSLKMDSCLVLTECFSRRFLRFRTSVMYQYEYLAQFENLNYGTITTRLRKGSAYSMQDYVGEEQDFNGNGVTWTLVNLINECIVPPPFEIYYIYWETAFHKWLKWRSYSPFCSASGKICTRRYKG